MLEFVLLWSMTKEKPSAEDNKLEEAQINSESQEKEIGGFENRKEPTRYGDWEVDGRCSDF